MKTIKISELNELRKNFKPVYNALTHEYAERCRKMGKPEYWIEKRREKAFEAKSKDENDLKKFDEVISKIKKCNGSLPPDSHGGWLDKQIILNAALIMIVDHDPHDLQVEVMQYGEGIVYIKL